MTTPPRHFKAELQELLDQRLDAPARAEVEQHLAVCAECRREFESLRWTKQLAAKQFAAAADTTVLRQSIQRALRAEAPPATTEIVQPKIVRPSFWTPKWKPVLACAAALALVAILAFLLIPRPPGLLEVIARDFRSYQQHKLALALNTADVKEMESYFATHGVAFNTRVFDLGMMNYQLAGGRVQRFDGQPTALFVYRGAANQILHCRMYVGTTAQLPAGAVERENNGIKFHIYESDGVTMVFWQEGAVVCALSSDIPSEQVLQLAFAKAMLPARAL